VDADRLVEAGQLEYLAIVVREAMGEHTLVLALRPDEVGSDEATRLPGW
jgi:hypothetical protein